MNETPLRRLYGEDGEPAPARVATVTVSFPHPFPYGPGAHTRGKVARTSCPLCRLAALPDKPRKRPTVAATLDRRTSKALRNR